MLHDHPTSRKSGEKWGTLDFRLERELTKKWATRLLHPFFRTPQIEIIETGFQKERGTEKRGNSSDCCELLRGRKAESTRRATACLSGFSTTHRFRRSGSLTNKCTCSGHDHITHYDKPVLPANCVEGAQEQVAATWITEQRKRR